MSIQIRGPYDPVEPVRVEFTEPSMTKESFKDLTDINQIVAKFTRTGVLEHANEHEALYYDVTATDFQQCMETVANAKSMFEELPSAIRDRMSNDPATFLEFVQDETNLEEMYELGLAVRPPGTDPEPPPKKDDEPPAKPAKGGTGDDD